MKQSLWRKFPRWMLAAAIVLVSSGLFAFWWFFLYPRWTSGPSESSSSSNSVFAPAPPGPDKWQLREGVAATFPDRMGSLVVVGNDLYDVESAEIIFQNWLDGGCPPEIFFDAPNRRVIGKLPRGLFRYELTGRKSGVIGEPFGVAFASGGKVAVFAKGGDIWKATPDWQNFVLTKELQVTRGGQFLDSFLTQNIQMGTENILIVRQLPNLLRVDLNTGEMRPTRRPPGSSFENQSPDGRLLAGMIREGRGGKFYAYDVEKDNAETFDLPARKAINDVLWMGKDRCVVLAGGDALLLYDRKRNALIPLTSLTIACNKMLGPSPGGKRFFCGRRGGAMLVDVEAKTAESFPHPAESMEWLTDDSLVYSATLPNSALRGTWFMRIGAEPVRLSEEPYLFARDGKACCAVLKKAGLFAFGTPSGLFTIKLDGAKLNEVTRWRTPASSMVAIGTWDL